MTPRVAARRATVAAVVGAFLLLPHDGSAAPVSNLLANGHFAAASNPLEGWRSDYRSDENRWYAANHTRVSVAPREGARMGVLRLATTADLAGNQGVKVDSMPVAYDPDATYRLTVTARAAGPNCRILIEGYQWKPGVKPCDAPRFEDLRKVYRQGAGQMLYFGPERSGPFSNPPATWGTGSTTFPGSGLSDLARQHLKKICFLTVHIVAIGGGAGELMVDEVVLEKLPRTGSPVP